MQDKIQEIMGLVEDYHEYGHPSYKEAIESKLRELVREPLQVGYVAIHAGMRCKTEAERRAFCDGVEFAQRAHGITSASGEV